MHRPITASLRAGAAIAALAAPAAAQDLIFPIGEGAFSWDAYEEFAAEHDFSGETLTIAGAGTGEDAARYEDMYAYFAEATGADVRYSGSESFEQDIVIGAQAGTLPDVASFPQPGLAQDLARQGVLVALDDELGQWIRENYAAGESWADLATFPGPDGEEHVYGLFFGTDIKSLVWYSPENFEEAGYEIPETMEELKDLTDRIVEDGESPLVHRARERRRHRLARDRLGRGHDAAHRAGRGLRPVDPGRDPLRRRARGRRDRGVRPLRPATRTTPPRAPRARPPRTSATAPTGSSTSRPSATCTSRRRSSPTSSPRTWSWARTPTSSTSRPSRTPTSASRCWARAG